MNIRSYENVDQSVRDVSDKPKSSWSVLSKGQAVLAVIALLVIFFSSFPIADYYSNGVCGGNDAGIGGLVCYALFILGSGVGQTVLFLVLLLLNVILMFFRLPYRKLSIVLTVLTVATVRYFGFDIFMATLNLVTVNVQYLYVK